MMTMTEPSVAQTLPSATLARTRSEPDGPMPALYLGHGAPPLVDDPTWTSQLGEWARGLPRPWSILMVSAHWESAPLTLGATETGTPLTYDFYGFPEYQPCR